MQQRKRKIGLFAIPVFLIAAFIFAGAHLVTATPVIGSLVDVIADGTAGFEDWAPGDTYLTGPTGDGIQQPGDDLNDDNGYVRTGDEVIYQVSFNVNDDDATDLQVEIQLNGTADAVFHLDDLPLDICNKSKSSISSDGRTITCWVGDAPIASTYTFNLPAYVSYDSENGQTLSATSTVTAEGAGAPAQTSDETIVSAAPRWDMSKSYASQSVNYRAGEYGFDTRWNISFQAGDDDPRGNSPIELPIEFSDTFEWSTNGVSSATYLVAPTPACSQPGGPGTAIDCTFTDTNQKQLVLFTPLSELDGFNGVTGDNIGSDTLENRAGVDSADNPLWDPDDTRCFQLGRSGHGDHSNNTDDTFMQLSTARSANKSFDPRDSGSGRSCC
ncbi:MAG: hypothetical protein R3C44_15075 [Chloroflexota bacterium]